jgi:tetratricopeptide (TPR) repeat protein
MAENDSESDMSRFSNLEFGGAQGGESHDRVDKDGQFYLAEANAEFARGQFEKGLRDYAKVLEFNPANPAAWSGQVRMLIELGEFHEARLWADKALEHFPRDPHLLAAKAVALARGGDPEAALAFSDAAIGENGEVPYVWLARGDVLMARGEKRAVYCFAKAFTLAPLDWMIQWLAARIHHYHRHFATALRHAKRALEIDASQAAAWLQLALSQQALGLCGAARNSLTQALELDPECHDAVVALGENRKIGFLKRLAGAWRQLFGT